MYKFIKDYFLNRKLKNAIENGQWKKMVDLIKQGAVTDLKGIKGGKMLTNATRFKEDETAIALINMNADLNMLVCGSTPLQFALVNEANSVTELLLKQKNLDIYLKDFQGNSAVILSIDYNQEKNAKLIIEKALRENLRDEEKLDIGAHIKKYKDKCLFQNLVNETLKYYDFLQEKQIMGDLIKFISVFSGNAINDNGNEIGLPKEIEYHIMSFIDKDELISLSTKENLECNLSKNNLKNWERKEPGSMVTKLLTDKIQIDYRNRRIEKEFNR